MTRTETRRYLEIRNRKQERATPDRRQTIKITHVQTEIDGYEAIGHGAYRRQSTITE